MLMLYRRVGYARVVKCTKRIIIKEENCSDTPFSDNKTQVTIVIVVRQTDLFWEEWKKG